MNNFRERAKAVMSVSQTEYLQNMKLMLLNYRGRVAVIMKNMPTVSILAKAVASLYDDDDQCVTMQVDLCNGEPHLLLLFYPKDIRSYYLYGLYDIAHQVAKNETGNDVPVSVKLLD